MKILNPFSNKSFKYAFLITIILGSVYLVLRLLFFSTDPFLPLLEVAYEPYLNLAENLAGQLFKMHNADVIIKDHEFIFGNAATYELARSNFFEKWQEFLLYRNWSVLLLFLIWANVSTIRKKIVFSIFFVIAHFFSVVSGLYLLGITGPELFEYKPHYFLSPTLIGTFFMFVLLVAWFKISKDEILNTIQKLKIKIVISDRKINEIFVLLFVFLLLRSFIIDFFDFPHYVNFLLETTRRVSLLWHHEGHIYGDQLVGENGALALSKHCLAFMTMFVFASIVYVTRQKI